MIAHLSGDSAGCDACQDEATDAYLNGDEPLPACDSPEDDGEGYCAICGHAVSVGSPHTPLQRGRDRGDAPPAPDAGSGERSVAR
jgi:hypothetical protein